MSDVHAGASQIQVILHNDEDTPMEFVIELLHSVFKKPLADAIRFTETVDTYGQAICGIYPRELADELLGAARQRIRASRHPLVITSEAVDEVGETGGGCKLCGMLSDLSRLSPKGIAALVCDDCIREITSSLPEIVGTKQFDYRSESFAVSPAPARRSWRREARALVR
jgi:ATP-dependent Clp protease adapter protein ClpS